MADNKPKLDKKRMKEIEKAAQFFSESVSDYIKRRSKKTDPDIQAFVQNKIIDITSGKVPVPLSYEDSDQTPVTDRTEAHNLRCLWSSGLDNNPPILTSYISDWMKTVWSGDYKLFLKQLENKSDSEIQEMINRRETLLNISPIFQVIIGARGGAVGFNPDGTKMEQHHMKIFVKLLSLGADINVHDVAGYTPLHHCLTISGNDLTLKMAVRLIKAGARVDARNRFGCTPLIDAAMGDRCDFIELLLENGADQTLKDTGGYSAKMLSTISPQKQKLMAKYEHKKTRAERKEKGLSKKCQNCFKDADLKKCTGCYHVWYCSASCQKEDWDSHKEECKKIEQEYKLCTSMNNNTDWVCGTLVGVKSSGKKASEKPNSKSHFVAKVQIPMSMGNASGGGGPMSVYNKERSFQTMLFKENNEYVYDELYKNVKAKGFHGLKGYFHVKFDANKPGKFKINSSRILPNEPW